MRHCTHTALFPPAKSENLSSVNLAFELGPQVPGQYNRLGGHDIIDDKKHCCVLKIAPRSSDLNQEFCTIALAFQDLLVGWLMS